MVGEVVGQIHFFKNCRTSKKKHIKEREESFRVWYYE